MTDSAASKLPLMIVDDESDNLDLLERTFRRSHLVFRATSGLEALELLQQVGEMAVIISDQRMPQMSGTEFLSKTVDAFPDTMRILLTGYSDVQDLVGAINCGQVFKYITKPWNPDELRQIVQQAGEIYRVVKQRTADLHRALRRESAQNAVMSAIRASLDYRSMLEAIVRTFHNTFAVDGCLLYPLMLPEDLRSINAAELLATDADDSDRTFFCFPQPLPPFLAEPRWSVAGAAPSAEPADSNTVLIESDRAAPSESNSSRTDDTKPTFRPIPWNRFVAEQIAGAAIGLRLQTLASETEAIHALTVPLCDPRHPQEKLAILVLLSRPAWSSENLDLIETLSSQVALALSQAKLYQQIQVQTEQMRSQLQIARQVQASLLRQTLPQPQQTRIQAVTLPAQEIGGDFFEVYEHPGNSVWLAVGDVSGKGVPAALLMASAISLLRRELTQDQLPNQVLQNLNESLFQELVASSCLITIALARYTPETGELIYANAGHVYPIVWSQCSAGEPTDLKVRGVPLGILPRWQADCDRLSLSSGDVMLMVSDGITEAQIGEPTSTSSLIESSVSLPLLRSGGLWEILRQRSAFDLSEIMAQIHSHCPVQDDDQTLLTLEVL